MANIEFGKRNKLNSTETYNITFKNGKSKIVLYISRTIFDKSFTVTLNLKLPDKSSNSSIFPDADNMKFTSEKVLYNDKHPVDTILDGTINLYSEPIYDDHIKFEFHLD